MLKRYLLLSVIGLAGCMPDTDAPVRDVPDARPIEAACAAPELQHLVGQALETHDFGAMEGPLRILPPGSMMTMDHNPARLNVDTDKHGMILRIWCG